MTARLRAEVIAIGDELTSGQRLDTNSQWISTQLAILGVPVIFHTTVTDTLGEGVEAFRIATQRADLVVATGGWGLRPMISRVMFWPRFVGYRLSCRSQCSR